MSHSSRKVVLRAKEISMIIRFIEQSREYRDYAFFKGLRKTIQRLRMI